MQKRPSAIKHRALSIGGKDLFYEFDNDPEIQENVTKLTLQAKEEYISSFVETSDSNDIMADSLKEENEIYLQMQSDEIVRSFRYQLTSQTGVRCIKLGRNGKSRDIMIRLKLRHDYDDLKWNGKFFNLIKPRRFRVCRNNLSYSMNCGRNMGDGLDNTTLRFLWILSNANNTTNNNNEIVHIDLTKQELFSSHSPCQLAINTYVTTKKNTREYLDTNDSISIKDNNKLIDELPYIELTNQDRSLKLKFNSIDHTDAFIKIFKSYIMDVSISDNKNIDNLNITNASEWLGDGYIKLQNTMV